MLPETDDGQKRIKKYLLENATPEVNPNPKKNSKIEGEENEAREKPEKFDENDPYNNKDTQTNTVDSDDSEW